MPKTAVCRLVEFWGQTNDIEMPSLDQGLPNIVHDEL